MIGTSTRSSITAYKDYMAFSPWLIHPRHHSKLKSSTTTPYITARSNQPMRCSCYIPDTQLPDKQTYHITITQEILSYTLCFNVTHLLVIFPATQSSAYACSKYHTQIVQSHTVLSLVQNTLRYNCWWRCAVINICTRSDTCSACRSPIRSPIRSCYSYIDFYYSLSLNIQPYCMRSSMFLWRVMSFIHLYSFSQTPRLRRHIIHIVRRHICRISLKAPLFTQSQHAPFMNTA